MVPGLSSSIAAGGHPLPGVNIGILFPCVTGGAETDGGYQDDQSAKRHNEPLFSLLLKSTLKLVTENDFFEVVRKETRRTRG